MDILTEIIETFAASAASADAATDSKSTAHFQRMLNDWVRLSSCYTQRNVLHTLQLRQESSAVGTCLLLLNKDTMMVECTVVDQMVLDSPHYCVRYPNTMPLNSMRMLTV